jgi:hypothetical protein
MKVLVIVLLVILLLFILKRQSGFTSDVLKKCTKNSDCASNKCKETGKKKKVKYCVNK